MSLAEHFWTFWSFQWAVGAFLTKEIYSSQDMGCDKGFSSFSCEDMSNWANSTQLKVGWLTHFTNLLFYQELVVKNNAYRPYPWEEILECSAPA